MKFHLHIGLEKTGTTSVQNTLAENSKELLKRSFAYYQSPFPSANGNYPNAAELLPYALEDSQENQLKSTYVEASNKNLTRFRSNLRKSILGFSKNHSNTDLIFSLEHLSRCLKLDDEWIRLKSLIEESGREAVVHVYLRRQDNFCLSFYPTDLIHGRLAPFEFPTATGINSFLNYRNLLKQLTRVFGKSALSVYSYDYDLEAFKGTLEHLSQQIGLDCRGLNQSSDTNLRMGAKEAEFLRQFNSHVFKSGTAQIPSHILRQALQSSMVSNEVYEPGHSRRLDFLQPLFSSNEYVNQEYFSGRQVLPTMKSDILENDESTISLAPDDYMQIFYNLLSYKSCLVRKIRG